MKTPRKRLSQQSEDRPAPRPHTELSRRERQIMEILYRQGAMSAEGVQRSLVDPPSYSAVRSMLRVLEQKGNVRHEQQGQRYVYLPIVSPERAKQSALRHLLSAFFDGSIAQVVTALLDLPNAEIPASELNRLACLIEEAKKRGE